MHCPQCGQSSASGEMRFCTRCGFALRGVKELLVPESKLEAARKNKTGKGVGQGLALFLFGLILITVLAVLRDLELVPQIFVKIAALIFCVGGVARMCSSFILGEGAPRAKIDGFAEMDVAAQTLTDNAGGGSLTQMQSLPLITFGARGFDTAKIVQPPSITERTTKLLKDQPERR